MLIFQYVMALNCFSSSFYYALIVVPFTLCNIYMGVGILLLLLVDTEFAWLSVLYLLSNFLAILKAILIEFLLFCFTILKSNLHFSEQWKDKKKKKFPLVIEGWE